MKLFQEFIDEILKQCSKMDLSAKFIYILLFIFLFMLSCSVLTGSTYNDDNIIVIRTAFSSIMGFMLENSTRKYGYSEITNKYKTIVVGTIALVITIIICIAYFNNINYYNPSLILFKNILFSCIGFLISISKNYE